MADSVRNQLWVAGSTIAGAVVGVAASGRVEGTLAGGVAGLIVFFFLEWHDRPAPPKHS